MPEYRTPGIYIEEISGGPRPVQAAATTDTGFVGILTLPKSFLGGTGIAEGMFVPASDELPQLTWGRALAFRGLIGTQDDGGGSDKKSSKKKSSKKSSKKSDSGNKLQSLIDDLLEGSWAVEDPVDKSSIILKSDKGMKMKIPARSSLVSVVATDKGDREWDLAFGADELQITQLIASTAVDQGVKHTGNLNCVDPKKKVNIDVDEIQAALQGTAPALTGMDGFAQWRAEFGENLAVQILLQSNKNLSAEQAGMLWDTMPGQVKAAWDKWLRNHPGMQRFELALSGFFNNGGQTAYPALGVQASGAAGPAKRQFLEDSFDGIQNCAMLCAPGLEFAWQQAILEYAGPAGRGDLFAILETPRYMFTKEPRGFGLTKTRWSEVSHSPYEMAELDTVPSPEFSELRFNGFSADELLDQVVPRDESGYGAAYGPWLVVENPLSTGPADKFVITPPSGHVAGVIAATDLKAGGGVHKAPANEQVLGVAGLVTQITDKEQAPLNTKGLNIIRRRPMAGIRIWGARTVASDPLWNYVNVRRLFLFVERSVRDALNWAVFLPNTDDTRADLKSTIAAFLYSIWSQGMLDGATWDEAFTVKCDRGNNPDVDVRSGLLTVDVEMRPVYPAEFIRIRFKQSPMRSEVTEG